MKPSRVALALLSLAACRRGPGTPDAAAVARVVDAAKPQGARACPTRDLAACRAAALAAIAAHDDARAVALAQDACDHGHPPACRTLGWLYEKGRGVQRDVSQASDLYDRACIQGELESCKSLGYLFDTAPRPDRARAARLYTRACDGGVLDACNNLANLYLGGDGVTRDLDRAIALYDRVCAAGGHPRACGNAQALRATRDGGRSDGGRSDGGRSDGGGRDR